MSNSRKNVFINCPFDNEYKPLLDALIYTCIYLGFSPGLSETNSSSDIRINNIKKLIRDSKYGIHDISRCRISKTSDLPRFNMPFELGLEIGCNEYGNKIQREKKILILEKEKYFYQKVLSDIAGQDIEEHHDKEELIIEKIRNWFSKLNPDSKYPSPRIIWNSFVKFNSSLNEILKSKGYSKQQILRIPISEYNRFVNEWIKERIL